VVLQWPLDPTTHFQKKKKKFSVFWYSETPFKQKYFVDPMYNTFFFFLKKNDPYQNNSQLSHFFRILFQNSKFKTFIKTLRNKLISHHCLGLQVGFILPISYVDYGEGT